DSIHACNLLRERIRPFRCGGNASTGIGERSFRMESRSYLNRPQLRLGSWTMARLIEPASRSKHIASWSTKVELLAAVLNHRYALKTSLNRNKGAWVVYVHGSSVGALKALVGAHMLPELDYKLVPRGTWTP